MIKIIKTENDKTLAFMRIVLGVVIFAHGAQKLLGWFGGHGISETIALWNQWWGIPAFLTMLAILGESLGSLALIFGFLGRIMATSIGLIILGAVYLVHFRWGFYMNWYAQPNTGEGFEYHILVMAMVITIIIKGSGGWSVDRLLLTRVKKVD